MSEKDGPRTLHWILVGATAIAIYAVIGVLLRGALNNLNLSVEGRRVLIGAIGALAAFASIAVAARMAPAFRFHVAVVLALLVVALNVALLLTASSRSGLLAYVFLPQLIGAGAGVAFSRASA